MIPVNEPILGEREKELLCQCIDTGWISANGPFVQQFEEMFAEFIGVKYAVSVCNGTAALETAFYAAGIGSGDEIIMPTFTIISCAITALRVGAKPVLVDSEPDTWNMDVAQVRTKITARTKAVLAVHIYGHPVEMAPLLKLAEQHNLIVIEDAAEAPGAEYQNQKVGSLGQLAAFSFYANKIITTGEGGMVVSHDQKMAERARSYRDLCFQPQRRFYHTEIGYNFRMTNLQAAVGIAQMERVEKSLQIKRQLAELYRAYLSNISLVRFQPEKTWAKAVYWMYAIELDEACPLPAEIVIEKLAQQQIGSRPFFLGLHEQPALRQLGWFQGEKYPVAERISKLGLYLPSGMNLTETHIAKICEVLAAILTSKFPKVQ